MTKILMVCLGNICRSPLAEGILKSKLNNHSFFIDSAGTANYHTDSPPDHRSITVGKKYGLDISKLKARPFTVLDFDTFDFIYVMDESNYNNVVKLARNDDEVKKVYFILNEVYPNQNHDVPDPYYGGDGAFENVYILLNEACDYIVKKLKQ